MNKYNIMNTYKIKNLYKIAAVLGVLLLLVYIVYYTSKNTQTVQALPVVVQKPVLSQISEFITQTGNTVAYNSVDLVARVSGFLDEVQFTDGSFVKKGTTLLVIEPEHYAEKLKEAQAAVVIAKATAVYDKAEYERQLQMYKDHATSLNNVQKWLAKSESSHADIDRTVANAEVAALNYSYTHIQAPFDGRIGRHLVDVGNYVGNGVATKLATIEQLSPIYVYFNLNELDLFKLRAAAAAYGLKPGQINQVPVYVGLQNEEGFPHEGRLDFVNSGLNASTGTMEFRALLPNKDYALLPGLFVQIRIALSKPAPKLTVPDTAVQYDQIGAYILVVDKDNNVVLKRVVIGSKEKSMRVILQGLDAQDSVIIDGLQNATPGHQVTPKMQVQSATSKAKK